MTDAKLLILVNLARLSPGWAMTHVSRFLPEIVAARPDDQFVARVPRRYSQLVESWGMKAFAASAPRRVLRAPSRGAGRRPDVVLGPLSHVPTVTRAPQIVWACEFPEARNTGDGPDRLRGTMSRVALSRSSLVIYPTAAARHLAETAGLKGPGLILRPPLRETPIVATDRPPASAGPLRILVPGHEQPGRNLTLLPRLSSVLNRRKVDHHIRVTGNLPSDLASCRVSGGLTYDPDELTSLRDCFDVVLIPAVRESCTSSLVEFERTGFPVAASSIDAHLELRDQVRLFDPASAESAADAVLAALHGPSETTSEEREGWRWNSPQRYATAISAEIDRLVKRGEFAWAV